MFPTFSYVVLLEEDHAVTPDFIWVIQKAEVFSTKENLNFKDGRDRFMIGLGTYKSSKKQAVDRKRIIKYSPCNQNWLLEAFTNWNNYDTFQFCHQKQFGGQLRLNSFKGVI